MDHATATRIQAAAQKASGTPGQHLQPGAKVVRAALKAAGLEHLVYRVTSGKSRTWVDVGYESGEAERLAQVAEVLRLLWEDSDRRIYVGVGASLAIHRDGWTSVGMADLEPMLVAEQEALADMHDPEETAICVDCGQDVRIQDVDHGAQRTGECPNWTSPYSRGHHIWRERYDAYQVRARAAAAIQARRVAQVPALL